MRAVGVKATARAINHKGNRNQVIFANGLPISASGILVHKLMPHIKAKSVQLSKRVSSDPDHKANNPAVANNRIKVGCSCCAVGSVFFVANWLRNTAVINNKTTPPNAHLLASTCHCQAANKPISESASKEVVRGSWRPNSHQTMALMRVTAVATAVVSCGRQRVTIATTAVPSSSNAMTKKGESNIFPSKTRRF